MPAHTYWIRVTWCVHKKLSQTCLDALQHNWECYNFIKSNQIFIHLSVGKHDDNEHDQCSCSCKDIMTFASYKGYTRLMSKSSCPVKLLCSTEFKENIQENTKMSGHFTGWGSRPDSDKLKGTLCKIQEPCF